MGMKLYAGLAAGAAVAVAAYVALGMSSSTLEAQVQTGAGTPITVPAAPPIARAPEGVMPSVMVSANPLAIQPFDRVMGNANAPITIIEYASMTCSHCRDFHTKTLPSVKAEWVDTGKAKYVLRDLPWDNLAMGMAKTARCAEPNQYYPLVDAYFKNQMTVVKSGDPLQEIKGIARLAGLDSARVDACIRDPQLHATVEGMRDTAREKLGVTGTPTTFVNGTKIDGFATYEELNKALTDAYTIASRNSGPATGGVRR